MVIENAVNKLINLTAHKTFAKIKVSEIKNNCVELLPDFFMGDVSDILDEAFLAENINSDVLSVIYENVLFPGKSRKTAKAKSERGFEYCPLMYYYPKGRFGIIEDDASFFSFGEMKHIVKMVLVQLVSGREHCLFGSECTGELFVRDNSGKVILCLDCLENRILQAYYILSLYLDCLDFKEISADEKMLYEFKWFMVIYLKVLLFKIAVWDTYAGNSVQKDVTK